MSNKNCYSCDSCDSCNSCYYCKGLRMSEKMIFCSGDGKYESKGEGYQKHLRIFNKDVSEERYQEIRKLLRENEIQISLTKWVEYKDLDSGDKTSTAKLLDGLLKVFSYEDAWATFWKESTQKQRDCITTLLEFDTTIFKEITGIDVGKKDSATEEAIALLKKNGYEIVKKDTHAE